jgi:hypothetical protein
VNVPEYLQHLAHVSAANGELADADGYFERAALLSVAEDLTDDHGRTLQA